MTYDVVIVGGGPGGLAAALALGRARRRVLVCDSGPRRNAAAKNVHNFVTRDGTPPDDFRRIGREQLAPYATVDVRDVRVVAVGGARGAFVVSLSDATVVEARRVLLCTGMVDEPPPIDGMRELWGRSIFQCPYCHGYEVRDRAWAYLVLPASAPHAVMAAVHYLPWTSDVTVLANGLELGEEAHATLQRAGIRVVKPGVARLAARDGRLEKVELADGTSVACEALFVHPPQKQVELVRALGLALDDAGFVKTDPMKRETSIPGIYASGDLTTQMQAAIAAAAASMQAAAMINLDLALERAAGG